MTSPIHTALHADKIAVSTSYYSEHHACYKMSVDVPKAKLSLHTQNVQRKEKQITQRVYEQG
jgi:hypothetical protein